MRLVDHTRVIGYKLGRGVFASGVRDLNELARGSKPELLFLHVLLPSATNGMKGCGGLGKAVICEIAILLGLQTSLNAKRI